MDKHQTPAPAGDDFCVVIPTKNEQDTIGNILDEVKTQTENILVVDGRSDDKTLDEVKNRGIRHVFDNQKGKGDALRVGVQNSEKEIIVFIDADVYNHNRSGVSTGW